MIIHSAKVFNFGSYKEARLSFQDSGLTLIQGPTGSGKSTLCDVIPWCLWGTTAKGGAVDEVISWPGDKPTLGIIEIEIKDLTYTVIRSRGKAKDNDLYFYADPEIEIRGKDLNDTQKLINELLGMNADLYLSSAYFHEFSPTAQFFNTTAKNRRALCEQLVDLSFAKDLQGKLADKNKKLAVEAKQLSNKIQSYTDKVKFLSRPNDYKQRSANFENSRKEALNALELEYADITNQIKRDSYYQDLLISADKRLANAVAHEPCNACGSLKRADNYSQLVEARQEILNKQRHNSLLKKQKQEIIKKQDEELNSENLFDELLATIDRDLVEASRELRLHLGAQEILAQAELDCWTLTRTVNHLRSITIENTIQDLENRTNKLLEDHFDAEIRVAFAAGNADKVDVTIYKDGNNCTFTQLSKGQRQLLKICFGISVMRSVVNTHAISLNCIFFDELTDGLDEEMKVKTFGLLQTLATKYSSIFLVEHSESLKAMFTNKYSVELVNGESQISES